ncbi:hypothetical protein SprV_0401539600 [Sparganum proliferum]
MATNVDGQSRPSRLFYINEKSNGPRFLVDTGADVSAIPPTRRHHLKLSRFHYKLPITPPPTPTDNVYSSLTSVSGGVSGGLTFGESIMLADRSYKSEQLRLVGNTSLFSCNNNLGSSQLHLNGYDEVFCVDTEEEVTPSKCRVGEKQNGHASLKTSPSISAQRCFLPSALDFCGATRFTFDAQRPFCLNKRPPRSPRSPCEPPKSAPVPVSAPSSDSTLPAFPRQAAFSSSGSLLGDLCGVPLFYMPSLSQVNPLTASIEDQTKRENETLGSDVPPVSEPSSKSSDAAPTNNEASSDPNTVAQPSSAKRKLSRAKNSKKSTPLSKHTSDSSASAEHTSTDDPHNEDRKTDNSPASRVCAPAKNAVEAARHRSKEKGHQPAIDADVTPTISKPQEFADARVSTELLKPDRVSPVISPAPEVTAGTVRSGTSEPAIDGVGDDSDFTIVTNKKTKSRPKQDRCSTIPTAPPPPRGRRVVRPAPMVRHARSPTHQTPYTVPATSSQAPRRDPPQPRSHQLTSVPSHHTHIPGRPPYHQRPARPAATSTFAQVVSRSVTESEHSKTKPPKPTESSPTSEAVSARDRKTESGDCSRSTSCATESSIPSPLTSSEGPTFSALSLPATPVASPVPDKLSKQHLLLTDFMVSAWSNFSKSFH